MARLTALQEMEVLTERQRKSLQSHRQKLEAFATDRQARLRYGRFLRARLDLSERAKQRTTAMSEPEEIARMLGGWQAWDRMLWLIAFGDQADLADFVAQPAKLAEDRRETVITMSDQVPVWLKPDSGKSLRPRSQVVKANTARKQRKRREVAVVRAGVSFKRPAGPEISGSARIFWFNFGFFWPLFWFIVVRAGPGTSPS